MQGENFFFKDAQFLSFEMRVYYSRDLESKYIHTYIFSCTCEIFHMLAPLTEQVLNFYNTDKILEPSLFLASCLARTWLFRPTIRFEAHRNTALLFRATFSFCNLLYEFDVSYTDKLNGVVTSWGSHRYDVIAHRKPTVSSVSLILHVRHLRLNTFFYSREEKNTRKIHESVVFSWKERKKS